MCDPSSIILVLYSGHTVQGGWGNRQEKFIFMKPCFTGSNLHLTRVGHFMFCLKNWAGHGLFCKNMRVGHIKLVFTKMNFSSEPAPPPLCLITSPLAGEVLYHWAVRSKLRDGHNVSSWLPVEYASRYATARALHQYHRGQGSNPVGVLIFESLKLWWPPQLCALLHSPNMSPVYCTSILDISTPITTHLLTFIFCGVCTPAKGNV